MKEGTFMWALEQMKKKELLTIGERGWYCELCNGEITYSYKKNDFLIKDKGLTVEELENTNWKIYKEDWNLSGRQAIVNGRLQSYNGQDLYQKDDIKTFIEKVKEDIEKEWSDDKCAQHILNASIVKQIIEKRAGDL